MTSGDKLELLALASKYKVEKGDPKYGNGGKYDVIDEEHNLVASIAPDGVSYYVSGVYNSGGDYAEIDMQALHDLEKFCTLLADDP